MFLSNLDFYRKLLSRMKADQAPAWLPKVHENPLESSFIVSMAIFSWQFVFSSFRCKAEKAKANDIESKIYK